MWRVLHEVRGYSSSRLGFVKRDNETGRWYAIEDASAKINISQAFRDGLHSDYKSSKKRKQIKRKAELGEPGQEDGQLEKNIFEALCDNETGRWYAVEETSAKINISQAFRDSMHSDYQSSKKTELGEPEKEDGQLEKNIFEALTRFEGKLDRPSPPSKRQCITTNEKAFDPSDHSLGRLGSTMDRLRNFLVSAPTLSEGNGNQLSVDLKVKRTDSWDTFAKLYRRFGNQAKSLADDPFEPKPINISSSNQNASFGGGPDSIFTPFSMSSVVEATSPVTPVASNPNKESLQKFDDAIACLQEAILPSVMSMNSLEPNEPGNLNGMGSISSLSTISDHHDLLHHEAWDSDRSNDSRNAVLQAS